MIKLSFDFQTLVLYLSWYFCSSLKRRHHTCPQTSLSAAVTLLSASSYPLSTTHGATWVRGAGAGMGEARCCHCPLGDSSGHPGPQMACCIWGARHARFRCQNNTGFLRSGVIASLLALPCVLTCGHPRLLCYAKRITKSQCFINFWDPLLPER